MNVKTSLVSGAAGGAGYYAYGMAGKMMPTLFQNKWGGPLLLAVLGHLLSRKPRTAAAGLGLVGAAGYALANNLAIGMVAEASGLSGYDVTGLQTGSVNPQLEVGNTVGSDLDFEPAIMANV